MSESYEKQITDLQSKLAESKAANKALEDKIVAEQQAEFDAKLTNLEETIAEQSTKIAEQEEAYKVLAEEATKHEATIAEKEEAIASKQEELGCSVQKRSRYEACSPAHRSRARC
jgi:chromosome segregation ATPase